MYYVQVAIYMCLHARTRYSRMQMRMHPHETSLTVNQQQRTIAAPAPRPRSQGQSTSLQVHSIPVSKIELRQPDTSVTDSLHTSETRPLYAECCGSFCVSPLLPGLVLTSTKTFHFYSGYKPRQSLFLQPGFYSCNGPQTIAPCYVIPAYKRQEGQSLSQ